MRDQFYVVLPSNSSMTYFDDNTTTHFITQLPQQITLHGSWGVALTEIQIPMTFQHISPLHKERYVALRYIERAPIINDEQGHEMVLNQNQRYNTGPGIVENISYVEPGVYKNIQSLLSGINELECLKNHLECSLQSNGYVKITRVCESMCSNVDHDLDFSLKLKKILGFDVGPTFADSDYVTGDRPANLSNGLSSMMMVYSDICSPYVTGDVQTSLLRAVSLNTHEYTYGSVRVKGYSPGMYIPLLVSSFHTIEIDIKDEFGEPIPFDCGTLTVTLHFKRFE